MAGTRNPNRNLLEKAATTSIFMERLRRLVDLGIHSFYTRPFTEDGLRMCVKWGAVSLVGGPPRIGKTCRKIFQ